MSKTIEVFIAAAAAVAIALAAAAHADDSDGFPPGDALLKQQPSPIQVPPVNGPVVLMPAEIGPTVIPVDGEMR